MDKPNNAVFESLNEIYLMALCIWAEARNQGLEGMQAVGSVILNRASHPGWWGKDTKGVILAPMQFSWLNADDPMRAKAMDVAEYFVDRLHADCSLRNAWWIAKGLLETWPETGQPALYSNVGKATHYHVASMPNPPAWRLQMTVVKQIKDHIFYV
jgi:spore germination cell wall hydrolase CwlJ-like protein